MDQLDAITLLYLSKHWDGSGSLLDCAHKFQQTRADLEAGLKKESSDKIRPRIISGDYHC